MRDFAETPTDEHTLSQPLTGALWDILVDLFHEELLSRGLISRSIEELADEIEYKVPLDSLIQPDFDSAYADDPDGFKQAFIEARDSLGRLLAALWQSLTPGDFGYAEVASGMLAQDERLNGWPIRKTHCSQFRACVT